ncbi:hypothetical protein [Thalassoglobus polymorphus]|uniref:Uncharacterized protein n=1 Tax=Thalassoglobus polymorphus TaxID=2527994 RepID=A0A517QPM7_9PLAN|nr:hypothetical protein [Thalassoglobus polymorphus]QDT33571.1 hypothetical protein Mal48_28240 [Thalassoglobus polymorphus]
MTRSQPSAIVRANRVKIDPRKLLVTEQEQTSPKVIVHRDQELIQSIEIQCSCGSHVVLDCDYGSET